ncbi:16S rRNA (cytidine1402-2'-O)-methyltransferase [Metamycoplasma subdolum]|uniref:Ribosomal RNA small subunit methyltransferase I n=1 Tax=Metamycoplasma subdolum TaxID=92407 RepID=A0A3M0A548_9BACT|nr:16S rRNA (cytidine(1402)-2'-O)-methyltransferase [Metamycoplasma subdolum]RMA78629.1 16S rRNA (cytidine1402-2'-O)-methyltransferase [Metamycoplasma subdolum]WPB50769.1 16S rRNA (cytidine(1402)-2'-O)-methyltransferase [Metamycoplasma subdolum]
MDFKLFVVGTPIGNLDDITLRAINTLKEVDIILCEDIRNSQKLLKHFEINNKSLISYHNFNERQVAPKIIKLIKEENKKVALISDAGMPCISDPGFCIISLAKKENIFVDVIGGPTALIHAIIKANQSSTFTFLGFLKDKTLQRQNELKNLTFNTYVAYVSPHKLEQTLKDFALVFNNEIDLFLIKEMTKVFETTYEGKPLEILEKLNGNFKGEFTIVFTIKKPASVKVNKYKN